MHLGTPSLLLLSLISASLVVGDIKANETQTNRQDRSASGTNILADPSALTDNLLGMFYSTK